MFHDEVAPQGPRVHVQPSLAVEIDWVLSGASLQRASSPPGLEGLYERRPDLAGKVRELWGPAEALSYPGFLELSILSHHGGLLFATDVDLYLGRLEEMAAGAPRDLPLLSETPDDRLGLLRRLEVLRTSPQRRAHYVEVITAVWSEVRQVWESLGRRAVDAAVAERRTLVDRGADWHEIARNECPCRDNLESLVAALGATGDLVVVPAYFTHKGLVVDLPSTVVVGVPADTSGTEARARTELLAQRLRAISDPTRLAMLSALAHQPMTVTEIAKAFALAQPTVSNHIKVMREAGVVANTGEGRARRIAVEQSALGAIVGQLRTVLGEDGS